LGAPRTKAEKQLAEFPDRCKEAGLRVTPQRLEVYRALVGTDEHPDAETLFGRVRERMPTVSLDTVYRTLASLEEHGLISRVEALGNRARFDANRDRHHHYVCRECGLVRDFYSEALNAFAPPRQVRGWGGVESVHVQLRGVCSECAKKRKGNRE
jgi:Fur family peroxide stress response transcriptional regulator